MPIWLSILLIVLFAIISGVVCFLQGINHRKRIAESEIGSAEVEARRIVDEAVKEAEAKAKIAIAEAEGKAKAMKVKADAEAYYNKAIAASLTQYVVMEDWIERWDGKLPTVQGGQNMMFDMTKFIK